MFVLHESLDAQEIFMRSQILKWAVDGHNVEILCNVSLAHNDDSCYYIGRFSFYRDL